MPTIPANEMPGRKVHQPKHVQRFESVVMSDRAIFGSEGSLVVYWRNPAACSHQAENMCAQCAAFSAKQDQAIWAHFGFSTRTDSRAKNTL